MLVYSRACSLHYEVHVAEVLVTAGGGVGPHHQAPVDPGGEVDVLPCGQAQAVLTRGKSEPEEASIVGQLYLLRESQWKLLVGVQQGDLLHLLTRVKDYFYDDGRHGNYSDPGQNRDQLQIIVVHSVGSLERISIKYPR